MTRLPLLTLTLVAGLTAAADKLETVPHTTSNAAVATWMAQPKTLSIGDYKRQVVIELATGKVTYVGMTPDEAAKVFWSAVSRIHPEVCAPRQPAK